MNDQSTLTISYYTDVLCVWAYTAQIQLDELRSQFGEQVQLDYHFLPLFGDVPTRLDEGWSNKGGAEGYSKHVKSVVSRFDHVTIHPDIWTRNIPASSASCHLFLKAIQLLEKTGEISAEPQAELGNKSLFEAAVWQFRLGFFRDLENISTRVTQDAIATDLCLPLIAIHQQIDSGAAYAALCSDYNSAEKHLIEGSPTFLLYGGRQKLYGNVGYRVIEANIQELLSDPCDRASWC